MRRLRASLAMAHPECALIDARISLGEPIAAIARRFGLSRWTIERRRAALRAFPEYQAAIRVAYKDDLQ